MTRPGVTAGIVRSVAQLGQRTCFGSRRPQVRILPLRFRFGECPRNYIHLAARGLTLFDVAPGRVERDLEQWQEICRWLDN